jgi:hypothetical protein
VPASGPQFDFMAAALGACLRTDRRTQKQHGEKSRDKESERTPARTLNDIPHFDAILRMPEPIYRPIVRVGAYVRKNTQNVTCI